LERVVCIHYHIFKNAGTTIDSILEKNFFINAVRIDTEKPREVIPMHIVLDFLNKNPKIKSFSSHQIRFPIPESKNLKLLPLIFIRHPIDRIFSIYSYNKKRSEQKNLVIQQARVSTLNEYIEWYLQRKENFDIRNFQVIYLSKNSTKTDVGNVDLELALKRLKNCSIIGVVDRLDESLVLAEDTMKKYFTDIDLSYIPKNVSNERIGTLDEKIDQGRTQLSESLWKELLSKNELDLKIYFNANEELDYRISKINNFEEKLKNFKERCVNKMKLIPKKGPTLSNRRIWYSHETKSFYHKNASKGTKTILCSFDKNN